MKYCILVSSYYPSVGGVQYVTQNLAEGLAERGHEVIVITSFNGLDDREVTDLINGVKVKRFDVLLRKGTPHGEVGVLKQYFLKTGNDYDVIVMVCFDSALVLPLLPLIWDFRRKKVLYMHNIIDLHISLQQLKEGNRIYRIWNVCRMRYLLLKCRKYLKKFDLTIHISTDIAYNYFTKNNLGNNVILSNFAEDNFFEVKDPDDKPEDKYIVYVANYVPQKNQELLIKAFYESKSAKRLVLIGSRHTEYYEKVKQINDKLHLEQPEKTVDFFKNISRKETVDLVRNAYVFVMTSIWEGMPIVLIESVSAGVPFISSDVGSVSDIEGGLVVKNWEASSFSKKIDELYDDEKKYDELRIQGIKYSRKYYTKRAYLDRFEELILNT